MTHQVQDAADVKDVALYFAVSYFIVNVRPFDVETVSTRRRSDYDISLAVLIFQLILH